MTTAIACLDTFERTLQQLAADILTRHRNYLRELRIEVVEGGVILFGRAVSFYGKQMAFHEVRNRCKFVVMANRIEVQERPGQANTG